MKVLVRAEFMQAIVVYAKIVRDFVAEDMLGHRPYLLPIAALEQYRLPVNADLIRRHQGVTLVPMGQWDAMIKTEQLTGMMNTCQLHSRLIRPFFNHDRHIVHPLAEISGQLRNRFVDQLFEVIDFHAVWIIPSG